MSAKAILFDLDGTLLPMDQDVFVEAYFKGLAKKLAPVGYDPQKLIEAVWAGTYAMIKNNGEKTNEEAFWQYFCSVFGEKARDDEPHFEEFYKTDFDNVKSVCGFEKQAAEIIKMIKAAGVKIVLATNPIFPAIATESRIRWAGLSPEDFEFYTTYENIGYCKPNPAYYIEILRRLGLEADECAMIGNDVGDDMVAKKLGMQVFLLTDNLINKSGADITEFEHGGYNELEEFIKKLLV